MEYLVIGLLVVANAYIWHNDYKVINQIFRDIEKA